MTNFNNTTLYTGVTNNLERRAHQHYLGKGSKFTRKYNIRKLVYYENFKTPRNAIIKEKKIKAGSRAKKIALIEEANPKWENLYNPKTGRITPLPVKAISP